jgi:hypothetical protein
MIPRGSRWVLIAATVSQWMPVMLVAQQEHVYFVKAANCKWAPTARAQTGFRVRGLVGIVTALHGVADCTSLRIQDDAGEIVWSGLNVVSLDVGRDVALLRSAAFPPAADIGIEPGSVNVFEGVPDVTAFGHPYGLKTTSTRLTVRTPPTRALADLVPPGAPRTALVTRGSPHLSTVMLSLQGPLVPGLSGAPVLYNNAVVGIANGGLLGGNVDLSWAVPWINIAWSDQNVDEQLTRLAAIRPDALFAFDDTPPPNVFPIRVTRDDTGAETIGEGRHMRTEVSISSDGRIDATIRIDNRVALSGFCGRVSFVLLDARDKVLSTTGPGSQYCVNGTIPGRSERVESWTSSISDAVLGNVAKVAILHAPGGRDPLVLLRQNVSQVLQSAAAVP